MKGKLIIFSAPSGSGKSTIVNALLQRRDDLEFSISATSRAPRGEEQNGKEYYFLTPDEFRKKIDNDELFEWEEVYKDTYYGSLKSEVARIASKGKNVVFDIDVVGGLNVKKMYGDNALAIFIQPPSIEELEKRLVSRGTDTPEKIKERLAKAKQELSYAGRFDVVIVNDDLEKAIEETEKVIDRFLTNTEAQRHRDI